MRTMILHMCRSTHLTLNDFSRKHAMRTSTPHDPHNEIYDIEGHRVCVINGTIDIYIDGVAYDQNELTKWRMEAAKAAKANKFHVRLP